MTDVTDASQSGPSAEYDENFPSLPSVANEHSILTTSVEPRAPETITEVRHYHK